MNLSPESRWGAGTVVFGQHGDTGVQNQDRQWAGMNGLGVALR